MPRPGAPTGWATALSASREDDHLLAVFTCGRQHRGTWGVFWWAMCDELS